ncbi:MoxR family ATPase [Candidatus Poribacteria bacterium]|nr:MoxR family ATPase [Candidatus Poribacteria bacterium]MBT5533246.1 MoxR family ATPase [Candidatus Poribacteria bacterium]MBT5710388.1 MoxR family ATPase [Candidatus Poribacteria bacterium]MBT7101674.1 MoxR family ATPase [Candidatus Poribacteria bacterium]MBT7806202.1 MoxR family ATPase [Candidatus Poribacteria bacterium]
MQSADQAATAAADIEFFADLRERLLKELRKVIVGQEEIIDDLLTALVSRGHCLLVGVPGLAKTLLISTLARAVDLDFKRVQFTPDLMPTDIIGSDILQDDPETGRRVFQFIKGPVFANVVLADEVNRTPPKTQAALLQAMQEQEVTAGGTTYPLPKPFFVLATQNPIEQEGTYPLPEAQLDRFMFSLYVDYPSADEEKEIVLTTTSALEPEIDAVLTRDDIDRVQNIVRRVPVAEYVVEYAVDLVGKSRPNTPGSPDFVNDWVSWGAGPRASQYLVLGAKARAILRGRPNATEEDIQAVARPVLRHRVLVNFNAEADGISSLEIVQRLLDTVQVPHHGV